MYAEGRHRLGTLGCAVGKKGCYLSLPEGGDNGVELSEVSSDESLARDLSAVATWCWLGGAAEPRSSISSGSAQDSSEPTTLHDEEPERARPRGKCSRAAHLASQGPTPSPSHFAEARLEGQRAGRREGPACGTETALRAGACLSLGLGRSPEPVASSRTSRREVCALPPTRGPVGQAALEGRSGQAPLAAGPPEIQRLGPDCPGELPAVPPGCWAAPSAGRPPRSRGAGTDVRMQELEGYLLGLPAREAVAALDLLILALRQPAAARAVVATCAPARAAKKLHGTGHLVRCR